MAWPAPGPVRGWPAPRVPGWAIGAWERAVSPRPGWAAGWKSGSTGCSMTTARTTGGSLGRSQPGRSGGGRPVQLLSDLPMPVGRSARAIHGPLPRRCPPPRGGAIPSRAVPWPRNAAAWRRSPAAHPRSAPSHPRPSPHPGEPAANPLAVLLQRPPPRATPPWLTLRWATPAAPGRPSTRRRPGPMTPASPCSAGNAPPAPPVRSRWRRSLRSRPTLPRAVACPAPPGAVRRRREPADPLVPGGRPGPTSWFALPTVQESAGAADDHPTPQPSAASRHGHLGGGGFPHRGGGRAGAA
jgi:hypothetical protein